MQAAKGKGAAAPSGSTPSGEPAAARPGESAAAPGGVSQDEIESLLKRPAGGGPSAVEAAPASAAAALGEPPSTAPASGDPGAGRASHGASAQAAGSSRTLAQSEVDALLSQARRAGQGGAASAAEPAAAGSTTAPPKGPPPERGQPAAGSDPDAASRAGTSISDADLERLFASAQQALASLDQPAATPPGLAPFTLKDFSGSPPPADAATLDLLQDVELDLRIEFGRTHLSLEDVLRLRKGSVVALDKLAGDPVDIFVNDRLIARGEVLVLNDNFCIRVAELVVGTPAG